MVAASREYAVPLDRLSFTSSLDAPRSFATAHTQAPTGAVCRRLWAALRARPADRSRITRLSSLPKKTEFS